jgi:hypothetical protein
LRINDIDAWCIERRLQVVQDRGITYGDYNQLALRLEIPVETEQLLVLGYQLLAFNSSAAFHGALLWIRDWSVSMEEVNQSGAFLLQQYRRAENFTGLVEDFPGHLFLEVNG